MARMIDDTLKAQFAVFDDIITTGSSYAVFANQLESFGANVLGGFFLGRTHYKYQ